MSTRSTTQRTRHRPDGAGAAEPVRAAVTPGFWSALAIREALASRHMGRVIAAWRTHPEHPRPISQTQIATWAGLTHGQISRIENGPAITDLDKLCQWAKRLAIPTDALWFELPGHSTRRLAAEPVPGPARGGYRLVRVADARPAPDPDLDTLHAFRSADRALGGGHLYSEVVDYLHTQVAPRLFGDGQGGDDVRALFTAAAGLTEMAAWMAHDAGCNQRAERHFHRARDLATVGRDHHLHVHVLASLTHHALHTRQHGQARRHIHDAETALSRTGRNGELVARVAAMRARTAAATGDHREAHRMLERAASALREPTAIMPSPWVSHYDEASLASDASRCLRALGDHRRAGAWTERIITLRPKGTRSRALAQITLASTLINQGQPDGAIAEAEEAIDGIDEVNSHLLTQQLRGIATQLLPYHSNQAVRQFADQLDTVICERTSMHRLADTL